MGLGLSASESYPWSGWDSMQDQGYPFTFRKLKHEIEILNEAPLKQRVMKTQVERASFFFCSSCSLCRECISPSAGARSLFHMFHRVDGSTKSKHHESQSKSTQSQILIFQRQASKPSRRFFASSTALRTSGSASRWTASSRSIAVKLIFIVYRAKPHRHLRRHPG